MPSSWPPWPSPCPPPSSRGRNEPLPDHRAGAEGGRSVEDRGARVLPLRLPALPRFPSADHRLEEEAARRRGLPRGARGVEQPPAEPGWPACSSPPRSPASSPSSSRRSSSRCRTTSARCSTSSRCREWMTGKVGDPAKFIETYKSFGVGSMVQRADQLARAMKIQGVPAMVVGGRYPDLGLAHRQPREHAQGGRRADRPRAQGARLTNERS